uniref:Uncharacterized protein n=1 Tax=Solanum tuberosum TaxID=4113 RepID=M1D9W3_SOLTU
MKKLKPAHRQARLVIRRRDALRPSFQLVVLNNENEVSLICAKYRKVLNEGMGDNIPKGLVRSILRSGLKNRHVESFGEPGRARQTTRRFKANPFGEFDLAHQRDLATRRLDQYGTHKLKRATS